MSAPRLEFHPLTAERWPDLERLFGERGACGGCWCMWWRLKRKDWEAGRGASNKRRMKRLAAGDESPGLLAYADGDPVAWCAFEPRESYPGLERSRILARVDERDVWSVTCFFVVQAWRARGVSTALLREAARSAAQRGARVLEGYPHDLGGGTLPGPFVFTGLLAAFERAGFREVVRRSAKRPIVRKALRRPARPA